MKVLGQKVKEARKNKKISQIELAEGICTQATISNIESKDRCDSLDIFSTVCRRLDLDVEKCIAYTEEQKLDLFLDEIEEKCSRLEHKEAFTLLENYSIKNVCLNTVLASKYNYYQGITNLIGANDSLSALFYLHKAMDYKKNQNIYSILSINALGSSYALKGEMDKAKVYYDKSMVLLEQYTGIMEPIAYKAYFNSAKFYSMIKEYETSIQLCEQAIGSNKKKGTFHYIDLFYYELGFNQYMTNKEEIMSYKMAYYFATYLNNKELIDIILQDAKEYGLNFQLDENGVI